MEQLAIVLFGLESTHLNKCADSEKAAYNRMAAYFLLFILSSFLSFYYFFYLLTLNYFSSLPLALVLSFVFFSIIRFTLLTVQLPLGEKPTLKKLLLNGANIFRIILFGLLIYAVSIPLSSFVFRQNINTGLSIYKDNLFSDFMISKEKMSNQQLGSIQSLIDKKKEELKFLQESETNRGILKFKTERIQRQIVLFQKNLKTKHVKLKRDNKSLFEQYKSNLNRAGMPFKRFELMFSEANSILILLLIFCCLFLLLPLYMYVRFANKFQYSLYFSEEMVQLIVTEYNRALLECKDYLLANYGYSVQQVSLYNDPPFNRSRVFIAPKEIKAVNLFDHYTPIG